MMKRMSWQTTMAGVGVIFSALGPMVTALTDGNPQTNPDWNLLITAVLAGIGLMRARDNNKSSEDVGATKL